MDLPVIHGTYLWLIPDLESEKLFNTIIRKLANTYETVAFQPHITLAGVPNWTEKQLNDAVASIAERASQFLLSTKNVRCGQSPYQKLTLEIEITGEMRALHQNINEIFSGEFSKTEYPHISLLYSSLSCNELQEEMERIQRLMPTQIRVDRLAVVDCNGTPENWRMVEVHSMLKESVV